MGEIWRQSFFLPGPSLTEQNLPSQHGKTHVVTGGYSGVGYELVSILYGAGATVFIAGRNESLAEQAMERIRAAHTSSTGALHFLHLDLADLTSVRSAADTFLSRSDRLDVLVNNAGVMVPPLGSKTPSGHEYQVGVNVLGPFLFTVLLMPLLQKTAATAPPGSVRVLWAASIAVEMSPPGGLDITPDGVLTTYNDQPKNYAISKVANALLAIETARRYGKDGIISLAFNPGNLKTPLQRNLPWWQYGVALLILYPPALGAYTELFAGWAEEISVENNGAYIVPWGRIGKLRSDIEQSAKPSNEGGTALASRLWDWCEKSSQ